MEHQHLFKMLTLNPQLATTAKRSRSRSESASASGSDSESASEPPPYKRRAVVSRVNAGNMKKYHSGKLYIFDYNPITDEPGKETSKNGVHEVNCDQMVRFFNIHTRYKVCSAPPCASAQRFVNWWADELAAKDPGELVIVYYHGISYQKDDGYTWKFQKHGLHVPSWEIFEATNQSKCDALFILDCFMGTRGQVPRRSRRHTEYSIAGMHMPVDRKGKEVVHNNFTFEFTSYLSVFLENMKGRFKNWTARTTLQIILRGNKKLASNPLRVWTKGEKNKGQIKYRFVVEPEIMRKTGKIKFFRQRLETPGKESGNGKDEDDQSEDGFDYGEIEEVLTSQRDARKRQMKQSSARSKSHVTNSDDEDDSDDTSDDESSTSDESDSSDDNGSDDESTSSDDEHGDRGSDGSDDEALFVAEGNDGLVAGGPGVTPTCAKNSGSGGSGGSAIENDGLVAGNATVAPGSAKIIDPAHENDGQIAGNSVVAPTCAKNSGPVVENDCQTAGNAAIAPKRVAKTGPLVDDDEEETVGQPAMQQDKTRTPVIPQEMQQCQVHTPAIRQEVQQRKIHSPVIDLTVADDADDEHEVEDIKPLIFVKVERCSTGHVLGSGSLDQPYLID